MHVKELCLVTQCRNAKICAEWRWFDVVSIHLIIISKLKHRVKKIIFMNLVSKMFNHSILIAKMRYFQLNLFALNFVFRWQLFHLRESGPRRRMLRRNRRYNSIPCTRAKPHRYLHHVRRSHALSTQRRFDQQQQPTRPPWCVSPPERLSAVMEEQISPPICSERDP